MSMPSRLAVLMFTDLVDSTGLKGRIGTAAYVPLIARHNKLFESICAEQGGEILGRTGDGFFAAFRTASEAVRAALRFQHAMRTEPWPVPLSARVGIHIGELAVLAGAAPDRPDVVGVAADLASRVMSVGLGGQILLTRTVFNEARQFVSEHPADREGRKVPELKWVAHGPYLFKGVDEPLEVFEVGGQGVAPLSAPPSAEKARRVVPHDQEQTLGWRPAVGLAVPGRAGWALERKLGEGGFGEVWLAYHQRTRQRRVFKFCFDVERLRSFKRELTLFRLLRDALGDRPDIARLYEVKLDEPPFFLESEWTEGGNLLDWSEARGGLATVPLEERLAIVADVAAAVAAAHSVGILHKDIKPSNILIHARADGTIQPRLSDFGIGFLADKTQLHARQITETGFTVITENDSSRTGTRMYAPPELLVGKPFTVQGDIYSLGVLLYQMVVADLSRPIGEGWEREVPDELTREDIRDCIDQDVSRRLSSATELETRIRSLPQRHAAKLEAQSQARRALRRRRLLRLSSASLVLLLIVLAVVAMTLVRERRLKQQAEVEKEKAQAVVTFLTDLLKSADPTQVRGKDYTVREALQAAEGQVDSSFRDKPDVRLALHRTLGETYFQLGLYTRAESHLRAALDLVHQVYGRDSLEAVDVLQRLGYIMEGRGSEKARYEALRFLEERYRITRLRLGENAPATVYARGDFQMLKGALDPEGDPDSLLEGLSRLTNGKRSKEQVKEAMAQAMKAGEAELRRGDRAGAIREFRKEADYYAALAPEVREIVPVGMCNLALRQLKVKEYDQAEVAARTAAQLADEIHGTSHPITAIIQANLAVIIMDRPQRFPGALTEANTLLRHALKIAQDVAGAEHPEALAIQLRLAENLRAQGQPEAALRIAREAAALAARSEEQRLIPIAAYEQAQDLLALGRDAEAATAAEECRVGLAQFDSHDPPVSAAKISELMQRVGRTSSGGAATLAAPTSSPARAAAGGTAPAGQ